MNAVQVVLTIGFGVLAFLLIEMWEELTAARASLREILGEMREGLRNLTAD
jgi:hypothetical protein